MTKEQEKVVSRTKEMLKRAFPEMTGKIIFRLFACKAGAKGIEVDMFTPNIDVGRHETKEVATVIL